MSDALPPEFCQRAKVGSGRLCRPLDYVEPPIRSLAGACLRADYRQLRTESAQHNFRVRSLTNRTNINHEMPFSTRNKPILRRTRAANVPIFELLALQWTLNYVDLLLDTFPRKQDIRW